MKKIKFLAAMMLVVVLCFTWVTSAFAFTYTLDEDVTVHAKQALLLNTDTNTVVYEKGSDEKIDPSALVKIMTGALVMEYVTDEHLDDSITISEQVLNEFTNQYSGYIVTGLSAGEKVTIQDLLAGLMIKSANDAAVLLADYVEDEYLNGASFIDVMNEKANELGCTSTHFVNTHGLQEDGQFSTASDLMKITQYALSFPSLKEICSYETYRVDRGNDQEDLVFYNTNSMILSSSSSYYSPAGAVRGATTSEGDMHLVTTATYQGQHYILVLLNCPAENSKGEEVDYPYEDTEALYRWALTSYEVKEVMSKGDIISGVEVPVHLSFNKKYTILVPASDVYLLLPVDMEVTDFVKSIHLDDEELKGPLPKGQEVGTMDLLLDGEVLATVGLETSEEIDRSSLLYAFDLIASFFSLPLIRILLILLVIFAVGYVLYMIQINSAKEQQKRKEELKRKRRNRE